MMGRESSPTTFNYVWDSIEESVAPREFPAPADPIQVTSKEAAFK